MSIYFQKYIIWFNLIYQFVSVSSAVLKKLIKVCLTLILWNKWVVNAVIPLSGLQIKVS